MVRRADRVITCSRYMRGHVAGVFGIRPAKITVIPNGIDPRDLEPVVDDLDGLRAKYARPDERLVLLVGRLVYEKGFHLALDALAPVVKRLGNVRFVVAGTGTAEAELKLQARRLGLRRYGSFVGWVGDDMLHSLYRVAEIVIVPSIYDRSASSRSRRWRPDACAWWRTPAGCARWSQATGRSASGSRPVTPTPSRRSSSGSSPTTRDARGLSPTPAITCSASTGSRWRDARSRFYSALERLQASPAG